MRLVHCLPIISGQKPQECPGAGRRGRPGCKGDIKISGGGEDRAGGPGCQGGGLVQNQSGHSCPEPGSLDSPKLEIRSEDAYGYLENNYRQ